MKKIISILFSRKKIYLTYQVLEQAVYTCRGREYVVHILHFYLLPSPR